MPDLDDELTLPLPSTLPPRDAAEADLPDRLAEIMEAIGDAPSYSVRVFRTDASGRQAMIATLPRLPDPDELGKRFGGGDYELVVQWRPAGKSTGRPFKRTISFCLDATYTAAANAERARSQGEGAQGLDLEKVLGLAERIASVRGGESGGAGLVAVTGMMERLMDRMDRMQERTDEKFEKILDRMVEMRSNPLDSLKETMSMAKELGIPLLGAPQEEPRAPWLEVAELVANNAGKFMEMMTEAQKSKAAQFRLLANPMARKVMAQAPALKDPAKRAAMIATLEAKLGPEKTKQIVDAIDGKTEAPK